MNEEGESTLRISLLAKGETPGLFRLYHSHRQSASTRDSESGPIGSREASADPKGKRWLFTQGRALFSIF